MRNATSIAVATSLLGMSVPAALASSAYTCETFSYGTDAIVTKATAINNEGQIVGYSSERGSSIPHAFLRDAGGTITSINSPEGSDNFIPAGINNLGQILGNSFILNPDGSFITIDQPQAPPGHFYAPYTLSGINDKGEVGGSFLRDFDHTGSATLDFFIREPDGTYNIVDEVRTGISTAAEPGPLNNSGFLLEKLRFGDAFLLQLNGPKIPLSYPGFPAMSSSPAGTSVTTALNNENATAGYLPGTHISFVRTSDGRFPSVACPDYVDRSYILGLNDRGVLVGLRNLPGTQVAFIATPTGLSPHLELSNDSWTFGPQILGQYGGSGRICISNAGPADFHASDIFIRDVYVPGFGQRAFTFTGTTCGGVALSPPDTMPPGGWCYVDFSFTPQTSGWQTAQLYITDESLESPHIIPLGGTGIGSTLQLSNSSWDFGPHAVGDTTGDGVIYIYNPGPAGVRLSPHVVPPDVSDFHVTGAVCPLYFAPYTACALTFNFTPTRPGERTAAINLEDNSNYSPISIPVMGYAY